MRVLGAIEQITLAVADLDAAKDFYGARLGLPLVAAGDDLAIYDTGQAKLIVARTSGTPTAGLELGFAVANLDNALARLIGTGARVSAPPRTEEWGGRTAKFADPAGNVVTLVQYP